MAPNPGSPDTPSTPPPPIQAAAQDWEQHEAEAEIRDLYATLRRIGVKTFEQPSLNPIPASKIGTDPPYLSKFIHVFASPFPSSNGGVADIQIKAARDFLTAYEGQTAYQKKLAEDAGKLQSDTTTGVAELWKVFRYENGRIETYFKDEYGDIRTKSDPESEEGKNPTVVRIRDLLERGRYDRLKFKPSNRDLGVQPARGPAPTLRAGTYAGKVAHYRQDGTLTIDDMRATCKPLWRQTVQALERYVDNDAEGFAKVVIAHPAKILSDLEYMITPGPVFDVVPARTVAQYLMEEAKYGVGAKDHVFRLGVGVMSHILSSPFRSPDPRGTENELGVGDIERILERGVLSAAEIPRLPALLRQLDAILAPAVHEMIELNVYAQALLTAIIVEASVSVLQKASSDDVNDARRIHTVFSAAIAFAALFSLAASIPLETALTRQDIFGSILDCLQVDSGSNRGHKNHIVSGTSGRSGAERLAQRIALRASCGTVVPGLDNADVSGYYRFSADPAVKLIMLERMYWGEEFVKDFKSIRGFA